MAPVVRACRARGLALKLLSTGQHREILDLALADMELAADEDLGIMAPGQGLPSLCAAALRGLDEAFRREAPAYVLAQGDTSTVAMAGMVCFLRRLPLGHVEAGLRSGSLEHPFPEELNRRLVTLTARDHFAPTQRAASVLSSEGVAGERVHLVGNTVIDALLQTRERVAERPLSGFGPALARLEGRSFVLVTAHRREAQGAPMERIADGLRRLMRAFPDTLFLCPLHPNPAASGPLRATWAGEQNAVLCEPLGYPALVKALDCCRLTVTDSGGIQEEAATLGRPALVTRRATDRQESVDAGVARLVGHDSDEIFAFGSLLLSDEEAYAAMARAVDVFGDGHAGERIADVVARRLEEHP